MKEKKTTTTPNKIKLNDFTVSFWDKRKEILYPISSCNQGQGKSSQQVTLKFEISCLPFSMTK